MASPNKIRQMDAPACDDQLLWDLRLSSFYYPSLTVADELGLFPLLEEKPATVQEIAASLSLGVRGTEAILGVLTSLGFLAQHQGKFSITEVSRNFLLPDSPYYFGGVLASNRDNLPTHADIRAALLKDNLRDLTDHWQAGGRCRCDWRWCRSWSPSPSSATWACRPWAPTP